MNTEQERGGFEKTLRLGGFKAFDRYEDDYQDPVTNAAWLGWKLRALQSQHDEETKHLRDALWVADRRIKALQSQDREDAERLDWLDKVAHCADWMENEPTKRVIRAHDGAEFTGDTWREAIDHARRVEGEGE